MMNKLVSVIIPVYNVEKYLEQCLDSVINQTYQNLQIILVDDGSTDGCPQICEQYAAKDPRVEVIHRKNGGLTAARNTGLTAVKGEYIGFVDSDDWIHPEMYRHLVEILEKTDADISTVEVEKTTGEISTVQEPVEVKVLSQQEFAKVFFKIGSQKIVYYVWNRLYKKELLEPEHFEEKFSIGEDVVASYKAWTKAEKIAVSNQLMYYYRQKTGMTSTFNSKYFQLLDVWNSVAQLTVDRKTGYDEYVKINQERIYFTLLMELALSGEYRNSLYQNRVDELLICLKKVKNDLLKADISKSRKMMIVLFCMNYYLCAAILSRVKGLKK